MKYDEVFITGCDSNSEWMLDWFIINYIKTNYTPILFFDFGVSEGCKKWLKKIDLFEEIIQFEPHRTKNWYLKPGALIETPSVKKVWLDTDCQVLGNLSHIFDFIEPNKIAMVEDKPWSKRRGETWYNSGVIGVENNPKVLLEWSRLCKNSKINLPLYGDQDIFHEMFSSPIIKNQFVTVLPNKYNYLRLQIEDNDKVDDVKIIHWTGLKGKEKIKSMIK